MIKELILQNLKCEGCANTIFKKLEQLEDVSKVIVNVEQSSVAFSIPKEDVLAKVKMTLTTLGYPAEGEANSTMKKAKSFVSCATGKISN